MSVTGLPAADALTLLAGLSDDRKTAALLVSNFRWNQSRHSLVLKNLPWTGKSHMESLLIDATHELQPTDKVEFDPEAATIKLNLPESTVLFIRLTQS